MNAFIVTVAILAATVLASTTTHAQSAIGNGVYVKVGSNLDRHDIHTRVEVLVACTGQGWKQVIGGSDPKYCRPGADIEVKWHPTPTFPGRTPIHSYSVNEIEAQGCTQWDAPVFLVNGKFEPGSGKIGSYLTQNGCKGCWFGNGDCYIDHGIKRTKPRPM